MNLANWGRALWLAAGLVATGAAHAIKEGEPAPAFEATMLDGSRYVFASAAGEVLVINFWATWCPPCRAEMPAFEAFYRKHRAQGLRFIAISMDDAADELKVREFMRDYSFPAALAKDARFKGYGRIWRIPLTFVIDRRGILRKDGWYAGESGIDAAMLEREVAPLLQLP
ncbi:MAG: TlpA family protein disulfide reductase [Rhodocyclaceae bacterium]|nr:TlpA family protein disulfide reductase [Rhodocyclaceae bacterium]MBX3668347.1 TlpA family protein disulfide reductase [Rhodocyclaceae bacterium]